MDFSVRSEGFVKDDLFHLAKFQPAINHPLSSYVLPQKKIVTLIGYKLTKKKNLNIDFKSI